MRGKALLGILLLGLFLAGCNSPSEESGWPLPGLDALTGYVVDANAGAGVAGATISIYEAGSERLVAQVETDANGAFQVRLKEGRYDLEAHKEGYAGSRLENFWLGGPLSSADLIMFPAFHPTWPTTPPRVQLEKVEDGNAYDSASQLPYRIKAEAAEPLEISYIYAALGKTPGSLFLTGERAIFEGVSDTGTQYLEVQRYAVFGPTTFEAVVYDANNNRTRVLRYVEVTVPPAKGERLAPPLLQSAVAYTLGKRINFLSTRPLAAPAGGNLYVELAWKPTVAIDLGDQKVPYGWHIYRSFDGERFERIASVPYAQTLYRDHDPELAPGKKVYYRVTAFIGATESKPSATLSTTPLRSFAVHLVSPEDNAENVPTTPTFVWEPTERVSPYHFYSGAVWDTMTGAWAYFANPAQRPLVNRTHWTWNEDGAFTGSSWETLQRGRTYEWNLVLAYALDDPEAPTAVSIAADYLGTLSLFSMPSLDFFTFTTKP